MNDNIINFESIRKSKDPVKKVCDIASKEFKELIIIGEDNQGELKMITTLENYADITYIMEVIKLGLITKGAEENGEK
tara:strand:+ start:105 stop:338 length:234 start_codon:yes stop_codon:yes gene_type:complete